MKIGTWNIGSAYTYPDKIFDLKYFIDVIKSNDLDVIMLQEVPISTEFSIPALVENYPYYFQSSISPNHVDDRFKNGLLILSKFPITESDLVTLPNPNIEYTKGNGVVYKSFDKAMQVCKIENIVFANLQLLPLHVFNTDYDSNTEFSDKIVSEICKHLIDLFVLAGDFNCSSESLIIKQLEGKISIKDSLNGERTYVYPRFTNPDHIYISNNLKSKQGEILKTNSDHYLCISEIQTVE